MNPVTNPVTPALFARSAWNIAQSNSKNIAVKGQHRQFNYFYAVTLALNILCTSKGVWSTNDLLVTLIALSPAMISWKILAIRKNVPGLAVAGIRLMCVVTVIVESGQCRRLLVSTAIGL